MNPKLVRSFELAAYGRRKNGKCTCSGNWCKEHNDCVWECWDIENERHMTEEEYKCLRQQVRS